MIRIRHVCALLLLLLCSAVSASPLRWELVHVQFDDDGSATGWIEIDSISGALLDFDIRVSGGDPLNFPNYGFSDIGQRLAISAHPVDSFVFSGGDGDLQRLLKLTPTINLESAAGDVPLDLSFAEGNLECHDCTPLRLITAGSFHSVLFRNGFEGGPGGDGGGGDGD